MLDPVHNQGLRLCFGAFRTSSVESLYIDAHKSSLGARHAKLSLQYVSKIKSLPKHIYIYMKFEARPNAICIFSLRIRQFLTAFNIIFQTFWKHLHILCYHRGISDHQRLCWMWCIWRKIAQMHLFIRSFSWKYETGTVILFLFIQIVHGMSLNFDNKDIIFCWEFCGLCYSFSIKQYNFHEVAWFSIHIYHWNLGNH